MKKSFRKTTFLSALAIAVPAMGMAQDKVEASAGADLSLLREASGIVRNKLRARLKESLLPRRVIALLILVTHLVWGRLVCRLR